MTHNEVIGNSLVSGEVDASAGYDTEGNGTEVLDEQGSDRLDTATELGGKALSDVSIEPASDAEYDSPAEPLEAIQADAATLGTSGKRMDSRKTSRQPGHTY